MDIEHKPLQFRELRADEIDIRVAHIKNNGVQLLLYKDARADMNILDETVGAERWQRSHEVINGNLFCNVAIAFKYNDGFTEWVVKQDVGVKSYTEKEKGQASDSFKRACFNWGIGRELYTAPFIWIPSEKCEIESSEDKRTCNTKFKVKKIGYKNKTITELVIINDKTGEIVFSFPSKQKKPPAPPTENTFKNKIEEIVKTQGINKREFCKIHNLTSTSTEADFEEVYRKLTANDL